MTCGVQHPKKTIPIKRVILKVFFLALVKSTWWQTCFISFPLELEFFLTFSGWQQLTLLTGRTSFLSRFTAFPNEKKEKPLSFKDISSKVVTKICRKLLTYRVFKCKFIFIVCYQNLPFWTNSCKIGLFLNHRYGRFVS